MVGTKIRRVSVFWYGFWKLRSRKNLMILKTYVTFVTSLHVDVKNYSFVHLTLLYCNQIDISIHINIWKEKFKTSFSFSRCFFLLVKCFHFNPYMGVNKFCTFTRSVFEIELQWSPMAYRTFMHHIIILWRRPSELEVRSYFWAPYIFMVFFHKTQGIITLTHCLKLSGCLTVSNHCWFRDP